MFITLPVMMSVLMEQLINITDAIFLGHVGEVELGASALAGIYYLALYMLGFGFSLGLQVLIARRNGEENYKETGRTFFQGLYFLIALSIILLLLSKCISPILLKRLIGSPEVYEAVMKYLDWRTFGLLFALPSLALRSFFVGIIKTKVMSYNAFIMVSTNVVLNFLLIFGYGGFPALGIQGAAIASSLSELVSLLIFVVYLFIQVDRKKYGLHPLFDRKILKQVWNLSVWSMMHSFISVAPWFLFFVAVEHLGQSQLAISNIVRSVSAFFSVIVNSFAATTSSLVSNLIGSSAKNGVMPLCRKMLRLGYAIGLPLITLAIIFHQEVLGVYTRDTNLINQAFWPYVVSLSVYFLGLPSFIYLNAVSGTGNTRIAFVYQCITIFFYLLYLWILSNCFTAPLVVYTTVEHLFVFLLLIMAIIYMQRWKRKEL